MVKLLHGFGAGAICSACSCGSEGSAPLLPSSPSLVLLGKHELRGLLSRAGYMSVVLSAAAWVVVLMQCVCTSDAK